MTLGCEESPSAPSNETEETIIEEDPTTQTQQTADTSSVDSSFVIFDGTSFDEQSQELTEAGFTPIDIMYKPHLWGIPKDQVGPWELPPRDRLIEQAREARGINSEIAVLDIEHWPIEDSEEEIRQSMQNYLTVLDWFKQAQPDMKVGYYDVVPRKNWYAEKPQHVLDKWRANNDFLAPLAKKVDVFYPSLYTYRQDQEYWVKSAKLLLEEARRVGGDKPVYAFLWPQYLPKGNDNLRGKYISADFWRLQLETARKYADGVVIWFPYDTAWKEASQGPWLEVTKQFLKEMENE